MDTTLLGAQHDLTLVWAALLIAGLIVATFFAAKAWSAHDRPRQTRRMGQPSLHQAEETAYVPALYDERTMMRNRASFQQEIVAWIQRCEQTQQSFDLFHCALKLGGAAHDEHVEYAMRDIAERVRPHLRDTDILARFSHAEFIVMRLRVHAADLPHRLHEQLHVICSQPIQRSDTLLLPMPQLGSAQYPNNGRHSRSLLQVAQSKAAVLAIPVPLSRVA